MKKKNVICAMLILIFTAGIAVGAWQIYRQLHEYSEGADSYTDLEEYVKVPEASKDDTEEMPVPSESGETESTRWWPEVDFKALREINPDLVGWIIIEGTGINYPVVQGTDNQYYLKHLFTGEWNSSGCIFLDARNDMNLSDRNSILYGHHMKDGSMFYGLMEYKDQAYYEEHPLALFLTPEDNYEIAFFAGYVASVDADAWTVGFSSDLEFEEWLQTVKERSCFTSEITPAVTDRILTLSTCSYEFNNARCLAYVDAGMVDFRNKRNMQMLSRFPELAGVYENVKGRCILDGEIVVLANGAPDFYRLQKRTLMTDRFKIELEASRFPASFVAFDCIYRESQELIWEPLMQRKEALSHLVVENDRIAVSRYVEAQGIQLYQAAEARKLEGVVAKRKDSAYYMGKRTKDWIKFKRMADEEFVVAGYIQKGQHTYSLILAKYREKTLAYKSLDRY